MQGFIHFAFVIAIHPVYIMRLWLKYKLLFDYFSYFISPQAVAQASLEVEGQVAPGWPFSCADHSGVKHYVTRHNNNHYRDTSQIREKCWYARTRIAHWLFFNFNQEKNSSYSGGKFGLATNSDHYVLPKMPWGRACTLIGPKYSRLGMFCQLMGFLIVYTKLK